MNEKMLNFWERAIRANARLNRPFNELSNTRPDEFIVNEAKNRFKALTPEHQVTLSLMGW